MSSKKSNKRKGTPKPRGCTSRGPRASASWEEHSERVSTAISVGTDVFLQANKERIAKASNTQAAKNSYVAGMIDMLSLARGALGFWGADMILLELERLNTRRTADGGGSEDVDAGPSRRPPKDAPGGTRKPLQGTAKQKAVRVAPYDPMFA